jgi:tRNA uridine 5-carbamoylmethylation protein Kti12
MLMTKCIVLICGPPACLKSTLIKIFRLIFNHQQIINLQFFCIKKLYEQKETKCLYNFLSFDDLFSGYENEIIENESNWKLYRSLIADEIERIILSKTSDCSSLNLKYSSQILHRLHQSLENLNNILIIEDNFYYSSMRHRYRQIAQRANIGFTSIHLYSNLSVALQRNRKREISKRVSDLSIENIYSKYELFNEDLVINTTDRGLTTEHLNQILQRIEQACQEPEQLLNVIDDEQRRKATEINQQNLIYQIDQRLRKFISKYLQEKFKIINEKKVYAEMVNDKRQKFLQLIKQRFILTNNNEDVEQIFKRFLEERE